MHIREKKRAMAAVLFTTWMIVYARSEEAESLVEKTTASGSGRCLLVFTRNNGRLSNLRVLVASLAHHTTSTSTATLTAHHVFHTTTEPAPRGLQQQ